MLNPTPAQILRNIEATLVDVVEPSVTGTTARSALATIGHLLRHVVLRIEQDGALLTADIAASTALLRTVSAYCQQAGDDLQVRQITTVLAAEDDPVSTDPGMLAVRADRLRQAVQDVLIHLQGVRAQRRDDPSYLAARDAIRAYLRDQLEAEAKLIHPAFADKGPRR